MIFPVTSFTNVITYSFCLQYKNNTISIFVHLLYTQLIFYLSTIIFNHIKLYMIFMFLLIRCFISIFHISSLLLLFFPFLLGTDVIGDSRVRYESNSCCTKTRFLLISFIRSLGSFGKSLVLWSFYKNSSLILLPSLVLFDSINLHLLLCSLFYEIRVY